MARISIIEDLAFLGWRYGGDTSMLEVQTHCEKDFVSFCEEVRAIEDKGGDRMTCNTFVEELACHTHAAEKNGWYLMPHDGALRWQIGEHHLDQKCPITFVATQTFGENSDFRIPKWRYAAQEIGLCEEDAQAIVDAADHRDTGFSPGLRVLLLEACGMDEEDDDA